METPRSWAKRKASSPSRSGSKIASARSSETRAICKISRNQSVALLPSGDAGLGRPLPSLDFAVDNFGDVPHRRQLAAHEIPDPEAVVDRETLGRVLNAGS